MLFTLLIDIIWILYWGPLWNSAALIDWNPNIHFFVILSSGINIVLKSAILLIYTLNDGQNLKNAFNNSIAPYLGFNN